MACGGKMNKLLYIFIFILCGCPKSGSDELDIIQKERQEKIKELIDLDDEEFDDIPEAGEDEEEDEDL